jgi:hypothetical protein
MLLKVYLVRTGLAFVVASLPVLARAQAPAAPDTNQTPPAVVAPTPPPLPPMLVPPPLPPEPQFFYNDGGRAAGPVNLADLQAKVAAGAIGPATLVWKGGTPSWVAAKDLAELSTSFEAAVVAPTPNPLPATGRAGATVADVRSFLLGTWETEGSGPAGTQGLAKMVLSLGPDGVAQGSYTVGLTGTGGATAAFPVAGGWSVVRLSDKLVNLTLNLRVRDRNGQPQAVNSNAVLEIIDQDTLRDTAQGTISKRAR